MSQNGEMVSYYATEMNGGSFLETQSIRSCGENNDCKGI